ncbi:MAG: bifunctional lysylphosphatidylglycerol flippase/synthetase MprF [Gemmatimonadales bacterium]
MSGGDPTALAPDPAPSEAAPETSARSTARRWLAPLLAVAMVGLVGAAVHRELADVRYQDLARAWRGLSAGRAAGAALLTLAAYLALAGYDLVALRAIGRRFPLHRVGLASFVAYALSQTLGFPLLTGGAIRFRFWTAWGLSAAEISSAIGYVVATFTVGLVAITGVTLLLEPAGTAGLFGLPPGSLRGLGLLFLLLTLGYLAWAALRRAPLRWRGWELPVPTLGVALAQLLVAAVDWSLAAAVFAWLLPPEAGLGFATVLGAFLIAQARGIVSHVPGGLGVFEGVLLLLLRPAVDTPSLVAAMLAFRVFYYLVPFALGLLVLAASELTRQRDQIVGAARQTGAVAARLANRWIPAALPSVLGWATFLAGAILLISGATPSVHSRVRWLNLLLPLGVIELSHFVASLAGAALLVIGWGLTRRLDAAYRASQALLLVGILASLLKGFDWEEALALGVVFAALLPARRAFYRRAALLRESFAPGWTLAVLGVVGFTTWLGFFAFKHVQYASSLWWRFAVTGDAPRTLRAMVGIVAVLAILAVARLFRHAAPDPEPPTDEDLDRAAPIVREAPSAMASLALLGDKTLWFSQSGNGLLMFAVAGRSWVSMGDPIGTPAEQRELVWRFREEADRHGAWTVFYEVGVETLPLYLDLGLVLLKLGEEALVPLDDFSLEGSARKGLRRSQRDFAKRGAAFEIVPPEAVDGLLDELAEISAEWLADKNVREKSFSMGCLTAATCAASRSRRCGSTTAWWRSPTSGRRGRVVSSRST